MLALACGISFKLNNSEASIIEALEQNKGMGLTTDCSNFLKEIRDDAESKLVVNEGFKTGR